jgi:NAD(P)-dependent dehydrogenase (short-subunit alcohol dehydrogenase family)
VPVTDPGSGGAAERGHGLDRERAPGLDTERVPGSALPPVAIVTGASRGIGEGIARRLTAAGMQVFGVSRSPGEAVHLQCDLTEPDVPAELVLAAALEAYGRVDALVNNAGLLLEGNCWEQPDEDIDAMVALNLTVPFQLSQAVAGHWVKEGVEGTIVNVCSIESQVGWADPPQAAYAATKGGLLGLTRAQALELAPHGIRVVAVGPGPIATTMTPEMPELEQAIPLGGRPGRPQDVGDVVAFLISDAARYMTGEIVYVDGGYLLR